MLGDSRSNGRKNLLKLTLAQKQAKIGLKVVKFKLRKTSRIHEQEADFLTEKKQVYGNDGPVQRS